MATGNRERQILSSWRVNAAPWIRAVREKEIESRVLVTDRAIVEAVRSRQPRTVLDLGCGEGWLSRVLDALGISVVGVDVVAELVEAARSAGGGEFHLLSYESIAAGELEVSVDAVVCNFSLIGGEEVDRLLAAVPSLLTPGGSLIIQTLHPVAACGDLPYVDGWRGGSWDGFGPGFSDPAPWYFRTLESWLSLLESSGFAPVELREPRHPHSGVPASAIFLGTLSGAGAAVT